MSQSQQQPAPQTQQSAPVPNSPEVEEMGLAEMMRVMDVATTLRQEQELVEREFNVDQTKQMLRDKLKRTAELTGEELTDEQVEAAVNWYYDNLHEYEEPKRSFKWFLAVSYTHLTLPTILLV